MSPLPPPAIDLVAEIARVRAEFGILRSRILPLLLPWGRERRFLRTSEDEFDSLQAWRHVARELTAALPTRDGRPGMPIDDVFMKAFLHEPGQAGFHVRQSRIVWRIVCFTPLNLEDGDSSRVLQVMHGRPIDEACATERLLSQFVEFQDWFLGPKPNAVFVINAMCSLLPCFVELDLDFVGRAFDLEARLMRIRSDASADELEREGKLHEWSTRFVQNGFNNALLHVVASLANNHFDQIEPFLKLPAQEFGSYAPLMPHYLMAVLHQKVRVLRELLL